jgi:ubiquinone/menaquinone biosynthesis C-methylase UbiE
MKPRISTPPGGHAAVYDAAMWPFERAALGAWRRRLAATARGRVLEIGAGTGSQLRWYTPGADVTALEPDALMLERARLRATQAAARVSLVDGRAEQLPFEDASFDTAVSVFSLCSVTDLAAALSELRRVLVPGGTLLLLEHVHLSWEPGRALQTAAAPAWAAVAGGCRLDRDTLGSAREAGFTVLRSCAHVAGWIVEAHLRSSNGCPRPSDLID